MKSRRRGPRTTEQRAASTVDIDIEELVLEGFPSGERFQIAGAVEQELAQLLREQGPTPLWAKDSDFSCLDGAKFEMKAGQSERTIGAQIARSIYRGWPR